VQPRIALALALLLAGCSQILGIQDLEGPSDDADPGDDSSNPLLDCKAQRVVQIFAGNGGLAWFTLAWPAATVIRSFSPEFAYDAPARAKNVSPNDDHPLFVRGLDGTAIWDGQRDGFPTVFVAGTNETHSQTPSSIVRSPAGFELVAAGAVIQAALQPPLPVLAIARQPTYGPAGGAPPLQFVTSIDDAIEKLQSIGVGDDVLAQLRPTQAQLASYLGPGAPPQVVVDLATHLAFSVNAFRFGLIGTVLVPGFNDDPHNAFDTPGLVTTRADQLARVLEAFYRDLAVFSEQCGDAGRPLTLAENTVLIVTGDTPKNSFNNVGWPDGTPNGANLMYVRGNGFLRVGWFGDIAPGVRTNFDPFTGFPSMLASNAESTAAAVAGTLHAIARGDRAAVLRFTGAPYDGVITR
jgi:hypothetical protein